MPERALEHKRVLIAEDSWHIARALQMTVEGEGAAVVGQAPTVAKARALLADDDDVDLALVDIDLRGEMAYPLIEALTARGIKAIVISGYRSLRDLETDTDTVTVLGKPVQPDVLLKAMRRALCAGPASLD